MNCKFNDSLVALAVDLIGLLATTCDYRSIDVNFQIGDCLLHLKSVFSELFFDLFGFNADLKDLIDDFF